jgi:hypothetical protein
VVGDKAGIMLEHKLAEIDWPAAFGLLAFGAICWFGGWYSGLRSQGHMFDDGYRTGYRAGISAEEDLTQRTQKGAKVSPESPSAAV